MGALARIASPLAGKYICKQTLELVRLASEGKFPNRGIKDVVRSICCGNVGKMSTNPDEPKSRARTNFLLNNELEVRKFWDENKVF